MEADSPPMIVRGVAFKACHGTSWIFGTVAICLMAIAVYQAQLIRSLHQQLTSNGSEVIALKQSNALIGLRLTTLEAKDVAYGSARIIVAWDPHMFRGVITQQNLPVPPAGHDYQLWVLDPKAEAPISAGLIQADTASRGFSIGPIKTNGPGFAVSLEPSGGQSTPTGAILFAVAPEE